MSTWTRIGPSADSSIALRNVRLQLLDVVAVDRADVAHAERLEERRRLQELAHGGLERLDALLGLRADVRELAEELLELALPAHVHRVEADVGEAVRQPLGDARRAGSGGRPSSGRAASDLAVRLEIVGA